MMKGRRILAVVLALVMTISLAAGFTVYAAAPLTFEGATTVLFDQSFGGLGSAAGAPDFKFVDGNNGTWSFYDQFVMSKKADGTSTAAYINTAKSYDLTGAAGFELVVEAECTSNGMDINMPGGYVLKWHNNSGGAGVSGKSKVLALTKDGTVPAADADGNSPYVVVDVYDADTTYTIKYLDGVWTVDALTNTAEKTGTASSSFTWTDTTNPTFNGTFGVAAIYTDKMTVYKMKLTKYGSTATVNKWKYATDFKSTDKRDKYTAEGLTLPSAMSFKNGYAQLSTNGNISYTYKPNNQNISGDYGFTFEQSGANENARKIRFNYIDSKNYYELFIYHKAGAIDVSADVIASDGYPAEDGWVLRKISGETKTTLAKQDLTGTGFVGATLRFRYNIEVTNVDAGRKIDVTVTVPNSTTPLTMTATDTTPFEKNGYITMTQGYPGTSTKLYVFEAYSLVDEADKEAPVSYTQTIVDKTFTSADGIKSIGEEGFTLSATPSSFDDTNGIVFASNTYSLTYTNDTALKDSYTFKTRIYRNNNNATIKFSSDGTNYYSLDAQYNNSLKNLRLIKHYNDTDYVLYTSSFEYQNHAGRGVWTDVTVSVTNQDDGSVKIDFTFDANNATTRSSSYTDTSTDLTGGVDNGAPITNGTKIVITQGWAGVVRFKSFSLNRYYTESPEADGEVPEYFAMFYNDDGAIKEVKNGNIYFRYPVSRLGNYKVIATLHENNEMTDIRVIEPLELYSGKVQLFEVSDAANAKVRVYFFDAEDSLNRLTEVYELN